MTDHEPAVAPPARWRSPDGGIGPHTYNSVLAETLTRWVADPAAAATDLEHLRAELAALADPTLRWSDRATVERLVRSAAVAEAVALFQHYAVDEHEAAVSTSLFRVYLRENRKADCARWLYTFPSRITWAAGQLDSIPEESANELTFSAAMAVTTLG